jgi:serine/threonine protein kinase
MPKGRKTLTVNTRAAPNRSFAISSTGTFIHEGQGVRISSDGMKVDEAAYGSAGPLRQLLRSFDEIQMLEHLGHGGGGVVHKAVHAPTREVIAVKTINVMDEDKRHQLMRELKTLYKASSPFIVDFKGAFYDDMHVYVALEFMDGGSLQDVLRKTTTIPEEILANITRQIAQGMTYLHDSHQVHRDIKPGNILISRRGDVKLTDFGVTGELSKDAEALGTFVGTARYMAPEQLSGQSYSYPADIWALGICLMEFATGEHPYARYKCTSQMELHLALESEPLPELPATFSREFRDFTTRCLAMNAADRATVATLLGHPFVQGAAASAGAAGSTASWLRQQLDAYHARRARTSPAKAPLAMPSPMPSPMPFISPLHSPQPGEAGWTYGMAMSYHNGDLSSSPQVAAALAAQQLVERSRTADRRADTSSFATGSAGRPPVPAGGVARPRNGRPARKLGATQVQHGPSQGIRSPARATPSGLVGGVSETLAKDEVRHRPANRSRLATFRRQQAQAAAGAGWMSGAVQQPPRGTNAMEASTPTTWVGSVRGAVGHHMVGGVAGTSTIDDGYRAAAWAAASGADVGSEQSKAERLERELARVTEELNALRAAEFRDEASLSKR